MLNPLFLSSKTLWILSLPLLLSSSYFFCINKTIIISWHLLSLPPSHLYFTILLDPTALTFASTVLLIAANVSHFATSYIKHELFLTRFNILVNLFIFSILLLIFIPHLIFILLGWDGLGITSFLLVIYFQNPKSLAAGIITALINRIGDVLILLTIAILLNQGNWITHHLFLSKTSIFIPIIITIASITKSAQIPFSSWLPAAIAAPTPVSALVHSSTLVTAGVYLLIRFFYTLNLLHPIKPLLLLIASTTILIAGISAIAESDLKKIIALSTLRQLGLIIATLALNLPNFTFFHLLTHALFKALLFITAGTLIHHFNHAQDLRHIGNIAPQLPITATALTTANLALCGTPFLSAFYSKDIILEIILFNPSNLSIILIFFLATLLTSAYSTRFILLLFWAPHNHSSLHIAHDEDPNLTIPAITLATTAILAGTTINWAFIPTFSHPILPIYLKILPLASTILGIFISWQWFSISPLFSYINPQTNFHTFLSSIWFLSPLSSQNLLPLPSLTASYALHLETSWLDLLPPKTLIFSLSKPSIHTITFQANSINIFIFLSFIALIPVFIL